MWKNLEKEKTQESGHRGGIQRREDGYEGRQYKMNEHKGGR